MLLLPLLLAAADDPKPAALVPIAPAALTRAEPIDYAKDVQPIFAAKCTVCHAGNNTEGRYDMGTHPGVLKGGKRGPAVVPGKPGESNLYLFSSHSKKPAMPPKSEENDLTPAEVAVLKLWIEQGAKGPAGPEVKARPKVVLGLPPALVKPVRAVAVSPDGAVVAAGRGNQVHLFDGKTGAFVRTLADPELKTADGKPANAAHLSLVESMAYSPDGRTLATGSFREVTLWDPAAGTVRKRIGGFADRVVALAYSPDGKLLAAAGGPPTEEGEVKVFDAATGDPAFEIRGGHSDTVFGVAFSPDSKKLATAAADKFVKVFEVPPAGASLPAGGTGSPTAKQLRSFEGHTHHVMDVGWSADGTKVVSAGADNVVKVWDYEKGEKLRDIPGHQKQVTRLAVVPKTPTVLTASGDATVRLWNVDSGGQARQYPGHTDFVYAVAVSPDGAVVAAGGEEGVVRIYNGANGQLVKAAVPPDAEPKPAK
jgi:hypothetical protein